MGSSKQAKLDRLFQLLEALFEQQKQGATAPKLHRAHGFVDGYMQSVIDAGVVDRAELLALVARARASVAGPATRVSSSLAPPH